MGYNVKHDLRYQVNLNLSVQTDKSSKKLKQLSVNNRTYNFLTKSVGSKVRDLSDPQGNLGDPNAEYFVCSIDREKTGVIMTKRNGHWRVASIQVY